MQVMTLTLKQIHDASLNLPQVAPSLGFKITLFFIVTWKTMKVRVTW